MHRRTAASQTNAPLPGRAACRMQSYHVCERAAQLVVQPVVTQNHYRVHLCGVVRHSASCIEMDLQCKRSTTSFEQLC